MKATIFSLALLATISSGVVSAATLVTDLKLDGNFTDSCGNLSFDNTASSFTWSDSSPVSGSDGYVNVDNSNAAWNGHFSEAPSTTNFAISLFINASALPVGNDTTHPEWTSQWVFGGGTVSNGFPKIGIGSDGQIHLSLHNVGGALLSGEDNVIEIGEWFQIGASLTALEDGSSTWSVYINGNLVNSTTLASGTTVSLSKVTLFEGEDATSSGRYKGAVDDIKIYNVNDSEDAKSVMQTEAARLVPEPSTAVLSLLALTGLAVRRRR